VEREVATKETRMVEALPTSIWHDWNSTGSNLSFTILAQEDAAQAEADEACCCIGSYLVCVFVSEIRRHRHCGWRRGSWRPRGERLLLEAKTSVVCERMWAAQKRRSDSALCLVLWKFWWAKHERMHSTGTFGPKFETLMILLFMLCPPAKP
jgi:hypothetical protein